MSNVGWTSQPGLPVMSSQTEVVLLTLIDGVIFKPLYSSIIGKEEHVIC